MHFVRINITLYPLHFCGWLQVLIDVWASGVLIGPKTSVSWWTGWPSLHHLLDLMEKLLEEEIRHVSLLKAFSTKKRCYQCFKICYFIIHQNLSSGFGNEVCETCLKGKNYIPWGLFIPPWAAACYFLATFNCWWGHLVQVWDWTTESTIHF